MNKTTSFIFALALILGGLTTTAAQAKWFSSIGLGVAIHNGDAIEFRENGDPMMPVERQDFQSNPGLAFNGDIGYAVRDMFRFGTFVMNTTVFEKNFGDETLIQSNIRTTGGFVGAQFELGGGTPTRHYLYADYGTGVHYQVAGVKGNKHFNVTSFSHIFRLGVNVPEVFQSFGTGLELLWTFPDSSDAARTFSILTKVSTTF